MDLFGKKWRFASYNNAGDDGINDAGIETFSAKAEVANIREVIQNSIDQISDEAKNAGKPVEVEFDDFFVEPSNFPNKVEFVSILDKCIESSENNDDVKKFFVQSKHVFDKPIRVLRISDFNTTGLDGAEDDDRNKSWHSLIKSKGHSNKNMNSGGSFGIGKSAPFTCSSLRTVFYGSKVDNVESYIGVARLISHESRNGLTMGTGFFSDSRELKAILKPFNLAGSNYVRNTNGTDIFIMGYDGEGNFEEVLIESVLSNFFVTIHKKKLVVKYKNVVIDSNTLGQYIAQLDDKKYFDIKVYYDLLITKPTNDDPNVKRIVLDSKEFGEKYGIADGEAILLLKKDDDLNKRILMTREPGMSLFLQDRINGSIPFTGLLLIEGDNMNKLFKSMEVPAHDAWEPERCKVDKRKYVKAYDDLKKYLRKKVDENFGQTLENSISAFGMEEFFSDFGTGNATGKKETAQVEGEVKTKIEKKKANSRKKKPLDVGEGTDGFDVDGDVKGTTGTGPTGKNTPKTKGGKGYKGDGDDKRKYKAVGIKKYLSCRDENKGQYALTFKSDKDRSNVMLEFITLGEINTFAMNLDNVKTNHEHIVVSSVENNKIYLSNLKKDDMVKVNFEIDFDRKCMMEVNYFEVK